MPSLNPNAAAFTPDSSFSAPTPATGAPSPAPSTGSTFAPPRHIDCFDALVEFHRGGCKFTIALPPEQPIDDTTLFNELLALKKAQKPILAAPGPLSDDDYSIDDDDGHLEADDMLATKYNDGHYDDDVFIHGDD